MPDMRAWDENFCIGCEYLAEDGCDDFPCEGLIEDRMDERVYENWDDPIYEDMMNPCDFRDPGGRSALRNGPRIYPCPNCGRENMLTSADKTLGYQCDICADQIERGY